MGNMGPALGDAGPTASFAVYSVSEQLTLAVSRPAAVPGRTVTIDSARLELTPGQRFAAALLTLGIQASKGGHQQIELPEMANLQSVTLDGKTLLISARSRLLVMPSVSG